MGDWFVDVSGCGYLVIKGSKLTCVPELCGDILHIPRQRGVDFWGHFNHTRVV